MLVIFNKAPCTDRNESMINETVEKPEADSRVRLAPYKRAALASKALPHEPLHSSTKGGRLPKAVLPPASPGSEAPPRPHISGPSRPLLSSILHYPTDDLSDRRPPPRKFLLPASVRIKPAILFIFIPLPLPSSVFFLKIVCQHCLLGCTQWNRQCLLN